MIGISILGSTGSIGISTLDVVARHRDRYEVIALSANCSVGQLVEQCVEYQPQYAVIADAQRVSELADALRDRGLETAALSGVEGLVRIATLPQADYVMAAIVGAAGLTPTLAAAEAGKRVLLANKESLVLAGRFLKEAARRSGADILPIDSEHNALFQCLPPSPERNGHLIERIILTASGGPFREFTPTQLEQVTPEQACTHPNWKMGRKISVDSATLMNKGLEVIEAFWLFDIPAHQIEVVVHPQSIVHSLVSYGDGSMLAQMGRPDMRTPIAHALAWPTSRVRSGVEPLDLVAAGPLSFHPPDCQRFPCLRLAFDALAAPDRLPPALNAANEIAVAAFLDGEIKFPHIAEINRAVLERCPEDQVKSLGDALRIDAWAREKAHSEVRKRV